MLLHHLAYDDVIFFFLEVPRQEFGERRVILNEQKFCIWH